jgi:hypothetical protein
MCLANIVHLMYCTEVLEHYLAGVAVCCPLQKVRVMSGPVPAPNLAPVLAASAAGTSLSDAWITSGTCPANWFRVFAQPVNFLNPNLLPAQGCGSGPVWIALQGCCCLLCQMVADAGVVQNLSVVTCMYCHRPRCVASVLRP